MKFKSIALILIVTSSSSLLAMNNTSAISRGVGNLLGLSFFTLISIIMLFVSLYQHNKNGTKVWSTLIYISFSALFLIYVLTFLLFPLLEFGFPSFFTGLILLLSLLSFFKYDSNKRKANQTKKK